MEPGDPLVGNQAQTARCAETACHNIADRIGHERY